MAAKDALNPTLFHGSRASMRVGDLVEPTTPGYGTDELHAFATDNPENAAQYGSRVYKVAAEDDLVEDPYNNDEEYGNPEVRNYSSKKLRIIGEV